MKRPAQLRALDLCREYEQLSVSIVDYTKQIGNCLAQCMISVNATDLTPCNKKGFVMTHLAQAFEPFLSDDEYYPELQWNDEAVIAEILSGCPHCQQAYAHIQARKAAKKRLGAVKRSIRAIGRSN